MVEKVQKKQISETFAIGTLLAVVGGYLDAYTFLCRDGVFANAQTGNMVLFGVRLASGDWTDALRYVIPILFFAVGIVLAQSIKVRCKPGSLFHWRQITVAIEIFALCCVGFLGREFNLLSNLIVSLVCSIQVQSFRSINGNSYATTMCTGNLRSATEKLFDYVRTRKKQSLEVCLQYFGIIGMFIIGAVAGALLTNAFSFAAVFFAVLPLLLVLVLMFFHLD